MNPIVSVCPYAVMTVSRPGSVCMRSTSPTGPVEERLEDGRRARHDRRLLVLYQPERLRGGVDGQGDDGGAEEHAHQEPGLVAEGVEERVDDEVAVALAELAVGAPPAGTGDGL